MPAKRQWCARDRCVFSAAGLRRCRAGPTRVRASRPQVVDPMGSIDGWVDPEVQAMEKMIHSAIDLSFEERNRAKEGARAWPCRCSARAACSCDGTFRVRADGCGAPQAKRPLAAPTTEGHRKTATRSRSSCTRSAAGSSYRRARRRMRSSRR
eukprot:2192733-Prymnesium_polylepis.2